MGDTLRTDDQIYQATNQEELRRQIMSACVPKNEREHWASGEIARLERELADARAEIESKNRLVEQMREALKAIDGIGREAGNARREDALRCFAIAAAALAAEGGK